MNTDKPRQKVAGIGGMFFRSKDPEASAKWYHEHLGVNPIPMADDQKAWEQEAGPTAFAPFPADTEYFGRPEQGWMINFRVNDLDALLVQLSASGIESKVDTYPQGKFARIHDLDGNPIELWEPAME